MPMIAKIPVRGSRYGPFLSVGRLLGLRSDGTKDSFKAQFLPQWEDSGNDVEAAFSKRFLMIDLGMAELAYEDLDATERVAKALSVAARSAPEELRAIANAFGPSGDREDRESALERALKLGIAEDDDDPVAFWGVVLLVGAALLVSACCNETDSDCGSNGTDTDDDKGGGGTGGDTDG